MKLLIVIVNYRITDLTIDCLRSLSSQIESVPTARVAVCENGTGGDAAERLRRTIEQEDWGHWVSLTSVHPNRGFTGGNNAILQPALEWPDPPQYFLLLNADTTVRSNALKALVDFMDRHPEVGIAGSRMESLEGIPRSTAFRFHNVLSEFDRGLRLGIVSKLLSRWLIAGPLPEAPCQTDWTSGASMIIRREVFHTIGLLDEGYYTYFDDIDFCFNANKAGWPTWCVPDSHVMHLSGQSTGVTARETRAKRRPKYWFEARRRYFLKNHGPVYAAMVDAAFIAGLTIWRLRRLIQRLPDTDPEHLLLDSIRQSVFLKGFKLRPVQNPAFS